MASDRLLFKGYSCINPIPFAGDGAVNEEEYRRHVEFMIRGGVRFLMPCGLATQGLVLTDEERLKVVALTVEQTQSRVGVFPCSYVPIGTENTIRFMRQVADLGADGVYLPTPMVLKVGPEGIYRHFHEILSRTTMPVILYNSLGTTGNRLPYQVVARLLDEFPGRILGYKEWEMDVLPFAIRLLASRIGVAPSCFDRFIWSGLQQGTQAQVAVCGAVVPEAISQIFALFEQERRSEAGELFHRYLPLFDLIVSPPDPRYQEYLPSVLYEILNGVGFHFGKPRLPFLWPLPEEYSRHVEAVLGQLQLVGKASI